MSEFHQSGPSVTTGPPSPAQSATLQLLTDWRREYPSRQYGNFGLDYSSIYHLSNSVSLPNFGVVAGIALALDRCEWSSAESWKDSPRLKEATKVWLQDSILLSRPLPIAILNMSAELAKLVERKVAPTSLTEVLQSLGMRGGALLKLVRYQEIAYELAAPAITSIERILGASVFPRDFESAWNTLSPLLDTATKPLRAGIEKIGYSTQDLAEIFEHMKPGLDRTLVSRTLSGENLRNGASPGYLEILAHRDPAAISAGLMQEFSVAREVRQRKGRIDPHPSVLLRDVFGLSEECCAAFKPQTVLEVESHASYHLQLVRATFREVERGLVPVLERALSNRLQRELFIESNDFHDVIFRADQRQLLAKGVLGKSRMEDLLKGEYLPPLSQVKQLLANTGMPAFLEVKYRFLYADQNGQALNGVQRFVDALCEEHAESRNAFRSLYDSENRPWGKTSFERFFRSLAGGQNEFRSHLLRVAEHSADVGGRRQEILMQVSASFADLLSRAQAPSYVECIRAVCQSQTSTASWLDRKLAAALSILGPAGSPTEPPAAATEAEKLFNKLLLITQSPDESSLSLAWNALRTVMRVLPGISLPELAQIALERKAVSVPEPQPVRWVSFDFASIVAQAMGQSHERILENVSENRSRFGEIISKHLIDLFAPSTSLGSEGAVPGLSEEDGVAFCQEVELDRFALTHGDGDGDELILVQELDQGGLIPEVEESNRPVDSVEESLDADSLQIAVSDVGEFPLENIGNAEIDLTANEEVERESPVPEQEEVPDAGYGQVAGTLTEEKPPSAEALLPEGAPSEGSNGTQDSPAEQPLVAPEEQSAAGSLTPDPEFEVQVAPDRKAREGRKPEKSTGSGSRAKPKSADFDPDRAARLEEFRRRAAAGESIFGENDTD